MNLVDIAIGAAIVFSAIGGLRIGLVMGLYQLIVLIATLAIAFALDEPLARLLEGAVQFGPGVAELAAFVIVVTLAGWVLGLLGSVLLRPVVQRLRRSPVAGRAERVLGILPGAARGLVYAASIVFIARAVLPEGHQLRELIDTSTLAPLAIGLFERVYPFRQGA